MSSDEHIMETTGRARVVIRNGKVVEVGKPMLSSCPLAQKFSSPVYSMKEDEIRACIEERIRSYGMFTRDREVLSDDDFVLFGASEVLGSAIEKGYIDCAVIACDGAGTVIAKNPRLVQGIGGRMSGLVKTCSYPEVIRRIEDNGGHVVFPGDASMDQYGGVKAAYEAGMNKVAVTIADPGDAVRIRNDFPGTIIIAVHSTGISAHDAELLSENCDLVYRCASGAVNEAAKNKALAQFGRSVPVYAFTQEGKELVFKKLMNTKQQILITRSRLPAPGEGGPSPLV
jgi:putative methanogenesis marker protein 8